MRHKSDVDTCVDPAHRAQQCVVGAECRKFMTTPAKESQQGILISSDCTSGNGELMVDIRISVAGADPVRVFEEISERLGQEAELRSWIGPLPVALLPGEPGGTSDVLVAAASAGGADGALTWPLRTFLAPAHRSDIRITIEDTDGRRVEADAKRVGDIDVLMCRAVGGSKWAYAR